MTAMASHWEITFKEQLGMIGLGRTLESFFEEFIEQREVTLLSIEIPDLLT